MARMLDEPKDLTNRNALECWRIMVERTRHERAKDVVFAASELPRDQRAAYVDRVLSNDEELRAEAHSLLAWHGDPHAADPGASAEQSISTIGWWRAGTGFSRC